MYKNLCDPEFFTKENQQLVDNIQAYLNSTSNSLSMDGSSNSIHFNILTYAQGILAKLMAKDGQIRENLISTQSMLMPHL